MIDQFFILKLVTERLDAVVPGATDAELRVLLFDRLSGDELDPAQYSSIVARLRRERHSV